MSAPISWTRREEALLLVLVLVPGVVAHLTWTHHYTAPSDGHAANHVYNQAAYEAVLRSSAPPLEKLVALWGFPCGFPQAVYAVSALWHSFGESSLAGCVDSLVIYLLMLGVGAYLLGREAAGPLTGVAAASLALADPNVQLTHHTYWVDGPLAGAVMLALAAVVLSRGFSCLGGSVLLGIAMGVGQCTKQTFFWYLALPFVATVAGAVLRTRSQRRGWLVCGGIALACAAIYVMLSRQSLGRDVFIYGTDTLGPEFSQYLVGTWTIVCLLAAVAAFAWLDGERRHLILCLALAGAIAAPYILVNQALLKARWEAVSVDPKDFWGSFDLWIEGMPHPLIVLAILGTLVTLVRYRERHAFVQVLLALIAGGLSSFWLLPLTFRYWSPLGPLVAVLAVAWVPRGRFFPVLTAVGAMLFASLNLVPDPRTGLGPDFDTYLVRMARARPSSTYASDGDDTDPAARRFLEHLPGNAEVACFVPGRAASEVDLIHFQHLIAAHALWRGRALVIRMATRQGGNLTVGDLDPMAVDLSRMLTRGTGGIPRKGDPNTPPPDILVFPAGAPAPAHLARSLFGARYRLLPHAPEGFILLQKLP